MLNKIKRLKKENLYSGFLDFFRFHFRQIKSNGEWSSDFSREVLIRRNAVAVLIYDPNKDEILFTRQFRAGSDYQNESFINEIVAGLIDEGETPLNAMRREVIEETGVSIIDNIELIAEHYPSCGSCTEKVFIYYCEADLSDRLLHAGEESENEFIETFTLSFDEAINYLNNGKLKTANNYIALLWFLNKRNSKI